MAVDAQLATALKTAKTRPQSFAFVAKGAADGALLVSQAKVKPQDITDAKAKAGGGTVWNGRCFDENGTLIFEVAKEPPGTLAGAIRKVIARDAGLTLHVEVRVAGGPTGDETPQGATAEGLEAARAAWRTGRATAVGQLTKVRDAIKAIKYDDGIKAVILLDSIIKNLTPEPADRRAVEELRRYLATDDVIDRAHELTAFGVAIDFKEKLLKVLATLNECLPE